MIDKSLKEILLEDDTINVEELNHFGFNKQKELHNDQEVYSNSNYTLVVRELYNLDSNYEILHSWKK